MCEPRAPPEQGVGPRICLNTQCKPCVCSRSRVSGHAWIETSILTGKSNIIYVSCLSQSHAVYPNIYRLYFCGDAFMLASWAPRLRPDHRCCCCCIQTQGCITCNSCIFVSSRNSKRRRVFFSSHYSSHSTQLSVTLISS